MARYTISGAELGFEQRGHGGIAFQQCQVQGGLVVVGPGCAVGAMIEEQLGDFMTGFLRSRM